MTSKRRNRPESFTVDEANATLPLVRAIVSDLAALSGRAIDQRQRLSFLLAGKDPNDHDVYHQELMQIEEELGKDKRRLREFIEELHALGVQLANGPNGIVSFPAMFGGQRVFLSWKLGEAEVQYWHPRDADCADRQPLTSDLLAEYACGNSAVP